MNEPVDRHANDLVTDDDRRHPHDVQHERVSLRVGVYVDEPLREGDAERAEDAGGALALGARTLLLI